MHLRGTRVIVVGGSSGIGLAAARLTKEAGAEVTIVGRSPVRLKQAQESLGGVRAVEADITDTAAIGRVFEGLDRVDHVLVSAGTIKNGTLVKNDLTTLRQIVDERLWGVVNVVRGAAPLMTTGSITFTSGGMSTRPRPGSAMLTSMLAAVEAWTTRNHDAEWKQWEGWLGTIREKVSAVPSVKMRGAMDMDMSSWKSRYSPVFALIATTSPSRTARLDFTWLLT